MDELRLIVLALRELEGTASCLAEVMRTRPGMSVRPRKFLITPDIVWPGDRLSEIRVGGKSYYFWRPLGWREVAESIYRSTRGRPREVLRAVRRLQAAAEWCDARTARLLRRQ